MEYNQFRMLVGLAADPEIDDAASEHGSADTEIDEAPPEYDAHPSDMPLRRGGEHAMDELELPVQRHSKTSAYFFLAGALVCLSASGGLVLASYTVGNYPRHVEAVAGVIGLAPLAVVAKVDKITEPLGEWGGWIARLAVGVATLCGFILLIVAISGTAICTSNCGG